MMRRKGFLSVMLYAALLLCALAGCPHSSGGGSSIIVWTGNAPDGRVVTLTVTKAVQAQTSADGGGGADVRLPAGYWRLLHDKS
jgi:hypothetical protein